MRALVEEKIKDSKLGMAMRHMPSGYEAVNVMWMWAALLGLNISSWLQALTGHDATDGRAHGKRLRRELVCTRHEPCRTTRGPHRARRPCWLLRRRMASARHAPRRSRPIAGDASYGYPLTSPACGRHTE